MPTSFETTQTAAVCLEDLEDVLHVPGRADHLDEISEHLDKASSLARALWLLMDGADTKDERDRSALRSLACSVADHASAALYIFVKEGIEANAKRGAQS